MPINVNGLKKDIQEYWNGAPCNSTMATSERYSQAYFEEIENFRYRMEPYVKRFAQFQKYRGKRVLEIGVGAGTDFLQWARHGAIATGCDLTEEGVRHTQKRLEVYKLKGTVQQEDCEHLSFKKNQFDLVYSFGVIHHTPDTQKAANEIHRVLKPGGEAKVMIYNRYSWITLRHWIQGALKSKNYSRSVDDILFHNQESPGTTVYSVKQAHKLFRKYRQVNVYGQLTPYDIDNAPNIRPHFLKHAIVRSMGRQFGWNLLIHAIK